MVASFILQSCNEPENYLKSDLAYEKIGICQVRDPNVSVLANTIGERYVLEECLGENFKGEYEATRSGDTVRIEMEKGAGNTVYKITLDINTRPAYRFLTINGSTIAVAIKR